MHVTITNNLTVLKIIADFLHQYPAAAVRLNEFLPKYGKRLERLWIHQNQSIALSTDGMSI